MPDRTATRLLRVLEAEYVAITQGDFDDLTRIGPEKETLFTALNDAVTTQDIARQLSEATHRNQALLQAAMRGMKAAAQTLQKIQAASQGGVVYGSDGTVSRLSKGDQRLSQKL